MKTSALVNQEPVLDTAKSDYIVAHWLEAITKLHAYYHQLITCISQRALEPELSIGKTTYRGQCPMSQLTKLTRSMETELAKLSQDIDQVDRLQASATKKICAKLVSHTLRLTQLNEQAQTRLDLIKRSAS
ncbi:hypothetical protein [Spirosoma endbachense]|uniref:Uncharacterized protein n=1 Tax=Spirosoma endbachense TaxID=2666025 RepID=A0A6P1VMP1_9BACT|nr:hypothetical protein [Spirosoma endbachense]QHV94551.1 hypothetical protein GJR95_05765 [Spirosoma endbachense]